MTLSSLFVILLHDRPPLTLQIWPMFAYIYAKCASRADFLLPYPGVEVPFPTRSLFRIMRKVCGGPSADLDPPAGGPSSPEGSPSEALSDPDAG